MSKKLGFSTSKPTRQQPDPQEAADAWVKSRNAEPELPEPEKAVKAEPIVRMTFDLSKSLHRKFRSACHDMDRKMTDELRAFVVRFIEEHESRQS